MKTKQELLETTLNQQLATVRVLDRIAELNAEQDWVCDWGNGKQLKVFFLYSHCTKNLNYDYSPALQMLPTSRYGSPQTIKTVIKEMESDCLLVLGVSEVNG